MEYHWYEDYWAMPRNLPRGHEFFIGYYQTQRANIIMWHSSTRISPASFQHISLIRDIVFFCTSKVVL